MGQMVIKDGTGTGKQVAVTQHNKLVTIAVSEAISAHHAFSGDGYNVNIGTLALTTADKSAIYYLKNNEDNPLIITGFFYLLGNSNITGVDTLVQIERNPTGGTVVTDATIIAPVNRDFGSNNTLTVSSFSGGQGKTLTGSSQIALESIFSSVGRKAVPVGAIVLRKGNSVGITITPPTGNTGMNIQVALSVYRSTEDTGE